MRALIIEDEKLAREKLQSLIKRYDPSYEIVGCLDSVEGAVEWLTEQPHPDLIFVDIHLADGISFDIFEHVPIQVPVIFTTAYDQYAIKAFRVNSVDYLLKPIQYEDLERSLDKFQSLKHDLTAPDLSMLHDLIKNSEKHFKTRFITKVGDHIQSVSIEEIAFFYTEFKGVFVVTWEGRKHLINYTLEHLEACLDPQKFFRLNRKYIAEINAIEKVVTLGQSRLKVNLTHCKDESITISREKVSHFKSWLDQ